MNLWLYSLTVNRKKKNLNEKKCKGRRESGRKKRGEKKNKKEEASIAVAIGNLGKRQTNVARSLQRPLERGRNDSNVLVLLLTNTTTK